MGATTNVRQLGRRADSSALLDHAVQVGLVVYGVMHLLIAWTAARLAFGDHGGNASQQGALHQLARSPLGATTMYVVAAGFFALVVWQAVEAAVGHQQEDGAKRAAKRAGSAAKVVVYGVLGVSALRIGLGAGSSGGNASSVTAKAMTLPAGPYLVAAAGLVIIGIAGYLVYHGWNERFRERLDVRAKVGARRTPIVLFGKVGYISKGVAFAVVGALVVWAGLTHDPKRSGGLDQALHKVLQQPFGAPVLLVIAVGVACFGLYCFAWARHLRR